jgi:glutathione synthase/RimK-type ligase-like ATP-grasp enzyme
VRPPTVLLATCAAFPDGEPFGDLVAPLRARGVEARWAVWDDPAVDWAGADLVALRSTWDYTSRREEFLVWVEGVPGPVLNGARTFRWNTDKSYLLDLQAAGLAVVPTRLADSAGEVARAVRDLGEVVVKPTVGASGVGVRVLATPEAVEGLDEDGSWVVQPLVGSVRDEGEHSVYVLGGEVVSQVRKLPAAGGSVLVHEEYGGRSEAVPVGEEHAVLARRAVEVAERLLGVRLDVARVDQMRLADGALVVSELEVTEPGLYLDVLPGNADAFAEVVAARLRQP